MSIFEDNIGSLALVDIDLVKKLLQIDANKVFDVFLEEGSSAENANIVDNRDGQTMYEINPLLEIKSKLQEFERYENYLYLYFFGLGNGSFYKTLLKNSNHQCITVFEPELELIYIAFNLVDLSKEILEKRLVIKLLSDADKVFFLRNFLNHSKFYLKVYDFHIYSKFYDKYTEEINRVNNGLIDALKHTLISLGNDVDDMMTGLEHSLENIPTMLKTPTLKQLFAKAANTKTAIIVATGPSLEKQLPLLKRMQDYVTILCLDASFGILVKNGIKPDIVFSLERVVEVKHFFENIPTEFFKDVIFQFPTVMHKEAVESIPIDVGFFMRRDSYSTFFKLDDWGYLAGGTSVANIAYNFAIKCEFDNIVLIGQDLSFAEDGSSHSKNHVFGDNEVADDKSDGFVEAYGGNGNMVKTTSVWKAFLNFYSMQIKDAEQPTINCTEGGARIPGTVEMPFEEMYEKYVDKNKVKHKIILKKPSIKSYKEHLKIFENKKQEAVKIGKEMALKAIEVLQELDDFLLDTKKYTEDDIDTKITLNQLDDLIKGIDNIKTLYNSEPFASLYAAMLSTSIAIHEYDTISVVVMRENTEHDKKTKKIAWIKVQYKWLLILITNVDRIVGVFEKHEE